jgi:uncharacterized protein (TIGR04141 family)
MQKATRVRTLTIFLLKPGTKETEAIDEEVMSEVDTFPVQLDAKHLGILYAKQTPAQPPSWLKFFAESMVRAPKLRTASVSAVYITRVSGRLFALVFGHGRHLLRPGVCEERFGLRTTLNSVDPKSLRAVDVSSLEANPFHGKRQASREAPLGEFGVNLDQDILRAVTGRPIEDRLGRQMTGIDSLSVRVRTDMSSLPALLKRYLQKNDELTYREHFPWVDHVAQVRDPVLEADLFELLVGVIEKKQPGAVWAAIPDVIDWTTFDSFRYGSPTKSVGYDDITLDRISACLDGEPLSIEFLRRQCVFAMADGNPHPVHKWPFLQCLTAEVSLKGATYLLNANTWYRVSRDFMEEVDQDLRTISTSDIVLPHWGDEHEDAYNSRAANQSSGRIALMDRVMISHPGMASPIEFCDLYSRDHRLVHVKRYGQSSILSHLFMQGLVSADCLLSDARFRRAVNERLPPSHVILDPDVRPQPATFEVAFAIGSSETGPLKLPFFSRVTLRNVSRTLTQSYGYRVTLTKIRVNKLASVN